jgi:hypothetical protein
MAVTVQTDPYQDLIRKVGYSVGLESVLARCSALTDLYATERRLTLAMWKSLVEQQFGREASEKPGRKSPFQHVADFFSVLHLVKVINQQITPLYGLDALSIIYRLFTDRQERLDAEKVVLLTYLLEADGDIFLNLLQAQFEPQPSRESLLALIERKRALLSAVIRHPALRRKVFEHVNIKTQSDSKRKGDSVGRFGRRREPLEATKRTSPLTDDENAPIQISDDYMRKVIQTRKGWAREIELFGETHLTEVGQRLLLETQALGLRDDAGPFLFWPFVDDLEKLQIDPASIKAPRLSEWNVLVAVARSLAGVEVSPLSDTKRRNEFVSQLAVLQKMYKEGNVATGSIRHQLPLYIAQPVIVAAAAGRRESIPPFPQILAGESASPERRINITHIRGTQGGISVRG